MTDRPTQLGADTKAIQEAVRAAQVEDLEVPSRAYMKVWVIAMVTSSEEEANTLFEERYSGRVQEEDWRVRVHPAIEHRTLLELKLWNLMGEWKHREDALLHKSELEEELPDPGPIEVVLRGSRDEVKLREYGVKKLNLRSNNADSKSG